MRSSSIHLRHMHQGTLFISSLLHLHHRHMYLRKSTTVRSCRSYKLLVVLSLPRISGDPLKETWCFLRSFVLHPVLRGCSFLQEMYTLFIHSAVTTCTPHFRLTHPGHWSSPRSNQSTYREQPHCTRSHVASEERSAPNAIGGFKCGDSCTVANRRRRMEESSQSHHEVLYFITSRTQPSR